MIHPLKILLIEDQQLIREGLNALLSLESDLSVVGEAENGQVALDWLAALDAHQLPDVALLDMRMPVMDGVATAAALAQQYPTIKVLVLTTFDEDELIAQAMAVGAQGYLLKDTPSEELAMALRSVAKGYSQFGPGIVQKMMGAKLMSTQFISAETEAQMQEISALTAALTPREKDVFTWIGRGASNREIAAQLYLSEGTVKNHVSSLLSRLGLRDRTQAALLAQSVQLTEPDPDPDSVS